MSWAGRWARARERPRLLVVGGASLDIVHTAGGLVPTAGGAGLYTALAAARAGAEVVMFAPRPDPMPDLLAPALPLIDWIGPTVTPGELPRFEIAYDRDGHVIHFEEYLGAEPAMRPDLLDGLAELPATAYCVPFMDAALQRMFLDGLADRGCITIASTYGRAARREPERVRETLDRADLSFCNADEAGLLFGDDAAADPGRLRIVTRGAAGLSVYQGDHRTDVAGVPVDVVDPTGAGDTICGTTIARLLLGDHPVEAARRAVAAASATVGAVGPSAMLGGLAPPSPAGTGRVVVDAAAVDRIAGLVAGLDDLAGFDFAGEPFPAVGDPGAVSWFTAATLQQFGFWYDDGRVWTGSMIAPIDGADRKGSDYLWAMYRRWAADDPLAMTAGVQAATTVERWHELATDDRGDDPFPDPPTYAGLARAYGASLAAIGTSADEIVAVAAASPRPMSTLMTLLDHVGGYREDPLRKKSALLGVILRQRPERFLPDAGDDDAPPIVDYHVQRACLRTGLITVVDDRLAASLRARELVDAAAEDEVRRAAWRAVALLRERSGRTMGAVDWFLFQMRHRCPEVTPPRCDECPADPVCAHRIDLFQPVVRTTAY